MTFRIERLISEWRRLRASRPSRVRISFAGFLVGRNCDICASGNGTIEIGPAVHLADRVALQSEGRLKIGPWVFINRDTMIIALEEIVIGEGTRIAERVSVRDHDHVFDNIARPIREQGYITKPIQIGRECWIGCNATILKGVSIGDRAVVAAGAVVTRDIPPYCIAAGVPARVIRRVPNGKSVSAHVLAENAN